MAGASGGGSPTSLKPSDVLEFRIKFDQVDKPKEFGDAFHSELTQQGLHLGQLGGVDISDDQPFQNCPYRWDGDVLVYSVYCHHAGTGTYKMDFNIPGTTKVTKEFPLKSETTLPFFLARCNAATDRHRALVAAFDHYIHEGFINYMRGYQAAADAFKEYAERQKLTQDILLGILFAGVGGAAGGFVGGLVKFSTEQKLFADIAKRAIGQAAIGAVTDASKDLVKYTVRLGRNLSQGSSSHAPRPDDATPDQPSGTSKDVPGSIDPLNWYATIQKNKAAEEAKVATTIANWKSQTIDAIARGSISTVDYDPINAVTESTKLGDKDVLALGSPPSADEYEKNMWEAWIEKYAFTLTQKIGCGQWGYRVEDNVGKELKAEMERVAKKLAQKGIDSAWLNDALSTAQRIAAAKAEKSQELR